MAEEVVIRTIEPPKYDPRFDGEELLQVIRVFNQPMLRRMIFVLQSYREGLSTTELTERMADGWYINLTGIKSEMPRIAHDLAVQGFIFDSNGKWQLTSTTRRRLQILDRFIEVVASDRRVLNPKRIMRPPTTTLQ